MKTPTEGKVAERFQFNLGCSVCAHWLGSGHGNVCFHLYPECETEGTCDRCGARHGLWCVPLDAEGRPLVRTLSPFTVEGE